MPSTDVYITTKQRLRAYNLFSDETVEAVAKVAEHQSSHESYEDFFKSVFMPIPSLYINKKGEGVPVVDIPAKSKEKGVIVVHLPMANPLDANQLYHVATVCATNPEYRVIAFGNPSGEPFLYKEQNLNFWKRMGIGATRNLRPLVSAELEYLREQDISNVHLVGYSYGAHKALIETSFIEAGRVQSLTLIDPVAHPRYVKQLIEDFQRTFKPMGGYVNRTKIQTYFDARAEAAKTKHHKYALARSINIAIGFMMSRLDFIPLVKKLLAAHPQIHVAVAWGTHSELGNDAHVKTSLHQLAHDNPGRVTRLRLEGDTHSFANDVHLYTAIVTQSLN